LWKLLYGSGVRVSELCGINLDDFRDEDALLVRGKGPQRAPRGVWGHAQAAIREWFGGAKGAARYTRVRNTWLALQR